MNRTTVVFAAGRGGSPDRHAATLAHFEDRGLSVVAPHFPMIDSMRPTADDLLARAKLLVAALDDASPAGPVVGVGHSIGATILLAMMGAKIWLAPGNCLPIPLEPRLGRLAMLAPPVGFFRAPGALDQVFSPLFLRSGALDTITPPSTHSEFLRALPEGVNVDFQIVPDAGHFSFMDRLPPNETESLPDGPGYRASLTDEILDFALG